MSPFSYEFVPPGSGNTRAASGKIRQAPARTGKYRGISSQYRLRWLHNVAPAAGNPSLRNALQPGTW
ncbi:hypothetical protein [Terrimicrobium sacchariphilum]|uniref:hypothetical protein n=1 Tax=Terrimicrobium sacchariphilum TaxID=690879 RepID=UPI00129A3702|nr:hypothetical protein [Terrimicrobium sacchariphilum]